MPPLISTTFTSVGALLLAVACSFFPAPTVRAASIDEPSASVSAEITAIPFPDEIASSTPAGTPSVAAGEDGVLINNFGELWHFAYPFRSGVNSPTTRKITVGERSNPIKEVAILGHEWFVIKAFDQGETEYLLVSEDAGATFTDLTDMNLIDGEQTDSGIPHNLAIDRGRVFVQTGHPHNLYFRSSQEPWRGIRQLEVGGLAGPDSIFFVSDALVFWSVESNFFATFVYRAELNETLTGWSVPPFVRFSSDQSDLVGGFLSFFRMEETRTILMGSVGAILRNIDNAYRFDIVLGRDTADTDPETGAPIRLRRPSQFFSPSADPRQVIAAGGDSISGLPWLAWSDDDGVTWTDLSHLVDHLGIESGAFRHVFETPQGDLIAGLADHDREELIFVQIHLPTAMGDTYFPTATFAGQGYWATEGLGWVYGARFPWIWVHEQGVWQYVSGQSEDNLWLWDRNLGWLWTSRAYAPHYYRPETESTLYYLRDTTAPRWFYDQAAGEWIEVPAP